LATDPHLINAIPEDRRWGILHQAVWWNNQDNIKNLLKLPTCDSSIQTKETMSEVDSDPIFVGVYVFKYFRHDARKGFIFIYCERTKRLSVRGKSYL
jgi:hypothetical protein